LGVYESNVNSFLHREGRVSGLGSTWPIGKSRRRPRTRAAVQSPGSKIQEKENAVSAVDRGFFMRETGGRDLSCFRADGALAGGREPIWWKRAGGNELAISSLVEASSRSGIWKSVELEISPFVAWDRRCF
jgi:hypothetical protein